MPSLTGLIVCLPDAPADDLVAVVEVLIEEGFSTFALPASAPAYGEIAAIFGSRATLGVLRVSAVDQLVAASAAGARFALCDVASARLAEAAAALDLPCYLGAMTPTEVRAVLETSATGALLYPADVIGHAMAPRLAELGLADRVVPLGGLGAYAAGEWNKAGAPAVCVDSALLGDAVTGGSLSLLRDRCGSFRTVEKAMTAG
ncbi:beta/alpha barrel domain-containing protein [Tessaracoccus sp. G1721]